MHIRWTGPEDVTGEMITVMNSTGPSAFALATAVERHRADGVDLGDSAGGGSADGAWWSGTVHDGWDIGGNANGGYLLAIAARALCELTGRPDPITITAHYLAPGRPGPVSVRAAVVKQGKRFTTVSATMEGADGRPMLQILAGMGDLGAAGEDHPTLLKGAPPDLPDHDVCRRREPGDSMPVGLMNHLDVRLHPDHIGFMEGRATGEGEIAGWFSFRDGSPIDSIGMLLAADALPPAVFNLDLQPGWVPTVELTVHLRSRAVPGPLRTRFRTRFVNGGMLEEDGEVWDTAGNLVALSRQLALLPR